MTEEWFDDWGESTEDDWGESIEDDCGFDYPPDLATFCPVWLTYPGYKRLIDVLMRREQSYGLSYDETFQQAALIIEQHDDDEVND